MITYIAQSEKLNQVEELERASYETVIGRGFYEVGAALLAIRDKRLYRDYGTFEDYCQMRWQMSKTYANRLIAASEVIENLTTIVVKNELPQHETHVLPLTALQPEEQQLIWQVVTQTAPGGKVTAQHVKSVVNVFKEVVVTDAIDNGAGEQIRVSDIVKAVVIEETYERMKRQETHIIEAGIRKSGVPSALQTSESNEYYTPPRYIDVVRTLMGKIDVDPASNIEANNVVQAATFYSLPDDGLQYDWRGRVFLNPPYGYHESSDSNQERWTRQLIEQYQSGITTEAVLLVNAVTDRSWFQPLWHYPICFTDHRIRFYRPGGEPGTPVIGSVFVYFGAQKERFAELFKVFGAVVLEAVR